VVIARPVVDCTLFHLPSDEKGRFERSQYGVSARMVVANLKFHNTANATQISSMFEIGVQGEAPLDQFQIRMEAHRF
jgi:hypothetical protein